MWLVKRIFSAFNPGIFKHATKQTQASKLLTDLNDDVLEIIEEFLESQEDKTAFRHTCQLTYNLFNSKVQLSKATQLLELILQGEADEAMRFISYFPHLLFIKTQVQDFTLGFEGQRRIIKGSPYQAILGTADMPLLEWLYQQPFFVTYKAIACKQYHEQFPRAAEGIFSDYDEAAVTEILNEIFTALDQDPCADAQPNADTEAALIAFREYFVPREVTTGLHFDLRPLIKAFDIYNANYSRWQMLTNNEDRVSVFWRFVIGYLQRMAATVDAQAICEGLDNVIKDGKIQLNKRTLDCTLSFIDYYPQDISDMNVLGIACGVRSDTSSMTVPHTAPANNSYTKLVQCKNLDRFNPELSYPADACQPAPQHRYS